MAELKKYKFYHTSGRKIVITNIPVPTSKIEKFNVLLSVETLINEIETMNSPKPNYSFINYWKDHHRCKRCGAGNLNSHYYCKKCGYVL